MLRFIAFYLKLHKLSEVPGYAVNFQLKYTNNKPFTTYSPLTPPYSGSKPSIKVNRVASLNVAPGADNLSNPNP